MRSALSIVATVAVTCAVAAPAQGAQGTGLYEPFPSPTGGERVQRYLGDFGVRATSDELRSGRTVGEAAEGAAGEASASGAAVRAGTAGPGSAGGLIVGGVMALLLAVATAVLGQRLRRASGQPR